MPEARGSRFFHALVVVGAAVSATACGGRSEGHQSGEGGAAGGAGGRGGGAGNGLGTGGAAASGGSNTGGGGNIGGSSNTGGAVSGGTGGTSGMGAVGPFPEPMQPTAQWDCSNSFTGCVAALGVTAHQLTGSCPVDETRPRSAADCGSDELLSCALAVTVSGEPVLVNCQCATADEFACGICISLNHRNGPPVSCTPSLEICECAYTGILR